MDVQRRGKGVGGLVFNSRLFEKGNWREYLIVFYDFLMFFYKIYYL